MPPTGDATIIPDSPDSAAAPRGNGTPVEEQQVSAAGAQHDAHKEPSEDKDDTSGKPSVILVVAKNGTGREDTRPDAERDVR